MGGPEDQVMGRVPSSGDVGGPEDNLSYSLPSTGAVRLVDPAGVFEGFLAPEPGRYVLYVGAGCPFSARPWFVVCFYGMQHVVQVVRCFPGNGDLGWFFTPTSDWEKEIVAANSEALWDEEPVMGYTHLKEFYGKYERYQGKVAIPVLFDRKVGEIISVDSMEIAKALCGQEMSCARRKHRESELIPPPEDAAATAEHNALLDELSRDVSMKVYKIHFALSQADHTKLSLELFATFRKMEERLAASDTNPDAQSLVALNPRAGHQLLLADTVYFHTLLRFDLAYRWRFSIGGDSIEGGPDGSSFPCSHALAKRICSIAGISGQDGCIFPADIMRSYWFSQVLASCAAKKSVVPLLPTSFALLPIP